MQIEKEYRVYWAIDLTARDEREAAEKAINLQRNRGTTANVFLVVQESAHKCVQVDLDLPYSKSNSEAPPGALGAVLVAVKGGIANATATPGVDVEIVDLDDRDDDPAHHKTLGTHFAALVKSAGLSKKLRVGGVA